MPVPINNIGNAIILFSFLLISFFLLYYFQMRMQLHVLKIEFRHSLYYNSILKRENIYIYIFKIRQEQQKKNK